MNTVSSFCASRPRDAQNERDGARAAQLRRSSSSQQRLRRSSRSSSVAAVRQYTDNLALKWSAHRRGPPRGAAAVQQLAASRGGTRAAAAALRSISSVAAPPPAELLHQLRCSTAAATAGDSSGLPTMSGRGTRGFFSEDFHLTVVPANIAIDRSGVVELVTGRIASCCSRKYRESEWRDIFSFRMRRRNKKKTRKFGLKLQSRNSYFPPRPEFSFFGRGRANSFEEGVL